jgi:sugar phosphate isomerase/epimerase
MIQNRRKFISTIVAGGAAIPLFSGIQTWLPEPVTVSLGEGMVNWDLFFKMVKELNIVAPLTLHIEYPLLEKDEENFL